jgi:hypothetical protein
LWLEVRFELDWARVIGVWFIVRVPPDTLADSKVKKHPLEYGLAKVFFATPGKASSRAGTRSIAFNPGATNKTAICRVSDFGCSSK